MFGARRLLAPALRRPPPAAPCRGCLLRAPRPRLLSSKPPAKPPAPPARPNPAPVAAEEPMTREEMERVVQDAKDQERWMNLLMPERNWGITSPVTWLLFAACLGMYYYNNSMIAEREKEARLQQVRHPRPQRAHAPHRNLPTIRC